MKKLAVLTVVVAFYLSQLVFAEGNDRFGNVNWEAFSKNVVKGLATNNDGVKQAALQHIVKYGDNLNVNEAIFDIVGIYRNSENQKFRQLAVVALHKVHNEWAMGFLKRNLKFETNPTIKRQILDCMYQHQQAQVAKKNTEHVHLVAEK